VVEDSVRKKHKDTSAVDDSGHKERLEQIEALSGISFCLISYCTYAFSGWFRISMEINFVNNML
jgi:hypothetical protein